MGVLTVYRSDADLDQVEQVLSGVFGEYVGSSLDRGRLNLFVNISVESGDAMFKSGTETIVRPLQEVRKALAAIGVTHVEC